MNGESEMQETGKEGAGISGEKFAPNMPGFFFISPDGLKCYAELLLDESLFWLQEEDKWLQFDNEVA